MKVRWTRPALEDLAAITDYLGDRNPAASVMVIDVIEQCVSRLEDHPSSGRHGRVPGTRELVIPRLPYVVAYRIGRERIELVAVRHSARLWPGSF